MNPHLLPHPHPLPPPAGAECADEAAREAADDDARAQATQAAAAARQALAQALRRRATLMQDLDGEIARMVDAALARVTSQLSQAPSDYQQWVLPRLQQGLGRVLDELADSAGSRVADGIRQAWGLGAASVDAPIAAEAAAAAANSVGPAAPAVPAGIPGAALSVQLGTPQLRQLRAMQHFSTGLIKGATTDTVNRINRALGQVMLGVATPFDAMRTVGELLGDRTRSQVRGIVSSNLNTAFNAAAFDRLKEQAARDPAIRKQWRRSGKLRSRHNHDMADGQVQDVDQPFVVIDGHRAGRFVELMFPGDPAAPIGETINCGCVALAWKASWKMRNPGAAPGRTAPAARPKAAAKATKAKPPMNTQQRILDAFKAAGPTWRDVTGQPLVVDERLFPAGVGDARLTKAGQDLFSYTAVQAIKRPTEIWQTERVDPAAGELIRERLFLKRFSAAGTQWLGRATFRLQGAQWVPAGAYTAADVGAGADAALSAARAGARVWPGRR